MAVDTQRTIVIAHRGAMAEAPENTLAAFRLAIEQGANGIELDVRLSADGEVVVMHDLRVDRMTNGSGRVNQLTLEELKRLDAGSKFGAKFRGEKIPTLREVFETVDHQSFYDIELKSYIDPTGKLASKVVQLAREFRVEERVLFSCYTPFPLMQIKRLAPECKVGMIFLNGGIGTIQRSLGGWMESDIVVTAFEEVTQEYIARVKAQNRKIFLFTVNSPETIRDMVKWNIDGIITERPGLACQIVRNQ